jgi:hypothetical protein
MIVYKNAPGTENWRISDMASHIPEEMIAPIEPQCGAPPSLSAERIKQLALQKRELYLNEHRNEENAMKKNSLPKRTVQLALIAALVCMMSVTALAAALGGLDLFKGIFGDSAESIQGEIETPLVSASADGRDMTLEALVTDGFAANMVVSLTGEQPPDAELFAVTTSMNIRSSSWRVLEAFSAPGKTYYAVELVGEKRFDNADITLSLNRNVAPIDLSVRVNNRLGNAVVNFPAGASSGETELKELQISPIGFLLIANEENAQGGLPATSVHLIFADGRAEELELAFAPSDERVGGGGGAVIYDDADLPPLVTRFQGARNPDGELVISGQFSRVIDPAEITRILVDGTEYRMQERE